MIFNGHPGRAREDLSSAGDQSSLDRFRVNPYSGEVTPGGRTLYFSSRRTGRLKILPTVDDTRSVVEYGRSHEY